MVHQLRLADLQQSNHQFHEPQAPGIGDYVALVFVLTLLFYLGIFALLLFRKRHTDPFFKSYISNLWLFAAAGVCHVIAVFVSNDHMSWLLQVHTSACVLWEFWLQYIPVSMALALLVQRLYLFMAVIVDESLLQQGPYGMRTGRRNRLFAMLFVVPTVCLCLLVTVFGGSTAVYRKSDAGSTTFEPVTCFNETGWKIAFVLWGVVSLVTVLVLVGFAFCSGPAKTQYHQHVDERSKALTVVVCALLLFTVSAALSLTNLLTHTIGRVLWTILLSMFYWFSFTLLAGKNLSRNYEQLTSRDQRHIRILARNPVPTIPRSFQELTFKTMHLNAFIRYCSNRAQVEQSIEEAEQKHQDAHLLDVQLVYCTHRNLKSPLYRQDMSVHETQLELPEQRALFYQGSTPRLDQLLRTEQSTSDVEIQFAVHVDHLASTKLEAGQQRLIEEHMLKELEEMRRELQRRRTAQEPSTLQLLELYHSIRRWQKLSSGYVTMQRVQGALSEVQASLYTTVRIGASTDTEYSQRQCIVPLSETDQKRFQTVVSGGQMSFDPSICDPILHQVLQMLGQRFYVTYVTSDCSGAVVEVGNMKQKHASRIARFLDQQVLHYTTTGVQEINSDDVDVGRQLMDLENDWVLSDRSVLNSTGKHVQFDDDSYLSLMSDDASDPNPVA